MCKNFLIFALFCTNLLIADITEIIKEIEMSGKVSISFKSIKGQSTLFSYNSKRKMIPASNLKLISAAAILDQFGLDYKFETDFYWNGRELLIKGSGDPTISDRFYKEEFHIFHNLLKELKKHRITRIDKLSADNSLFTGPTTPPDWEVFDRAYYYAPELSPLSYNDNCIDLVTNGKIVKWFPFNTNYVTIINQQKMGSEYQEDIIKEQNTFILRSEIPTGATKKEYLAVSKPADYTLHVLKQFLEKEGIRCGEITVYGEKPNYKEFKKLFSHQSPEMKQLLKVVLHNSNNFFTEMLTWSGSAQKFQTAGSYESSLNLVNDFLEKIGFKKQNITDSCGLSRTNQLSTEFLTDFLIKMAENKEFKTLLATSDKSRSLEFLKDDFKGRIKAKTGSMSGIYALSGFVDEKYVFSIIINDSPNNKVQLSAKISNLLHNLVNRHVTNHPIIN